MKKLLAIATMSALLVSPTPTLGAFTDVTEGYVDAVTYLTEEGIINGYADDTFRPEQTVTRVQAARMFIRQLQPSVSPEQFVFADVLPSHSDYDIIMQAASLGILNGSVSGDKKAFKPGHKLTRAQLAKAFVEAYDLQLVPNKKIATFSDVPATAWFKPYVDILVSHGLMTGYSKTLFEPNEAVKRKHFASIYYRYLTNDALHARAPYVFGKALHAQTNTPIEHAVVSIYDDEELYARVNTGSDGTYRFDLPAGRYTMTVEKDGFVKATYTLDASATQQVKQMAFLEATVLTPAATQYDVPSWGLSFTVPEPLDRYSFTFPSMTELQIAQNNEVLASIHVYETGATPSFRGNWDVLREDYKGYDYYVKQGGNAFGEAINTSKHEAVFDAIFHSATFH